MLQFILERANYWAIIGLMMVGLYITFQSANLIKRLVGLSIFQTSVFLFYITLGKVAGGSAPIFYGRDAAGHGGDHGEEAGHGAVGAHGAEDAGAALHAEAPVESAADQSNSVLSEAGETVDAVSAGEADEVGQELAVTGEAALEAVTEPAGETPAIEVDALAEGAAPVEAPAEAAADLVNPLTGLQEVYSNPLPHVLILTAIVVGVATLAVGLAIAVRIREAYGTIEADEVREMDIETADAQDADDRMGVSA